MLDDAGWTECSITVSNSLDEHLIRDLQLQGAKIDVFGVGERLITGASSEFSGEKISLLGAVYKIAAVEENGEFMPRIKISGNVEKITNPGLKKAYRVYDEEKKAVADLIESKFPKLNGKVLINSIGTTIGSHTGPGTVALFFWGKERTE